MASLRKKPNSSYWIACFTDRTGKQRQRSTKTTDRKLALKLANEFESESRARKTARQVREVIQDLHREITGEDLATATLKEFAQRFLEQRAPETAPATGEFYKSSALKFVTWLGEDAQKDIADITKDQIIRYRNDLQGTLAAKTTNHHLKFLKMLFKQAKREGYVIEDPTEFVDSIRKRETGDEVKRRAFTLEELKAVLSACDDEWKSMVLFGLYTGQRLADIAGMRWSQIDLDNGNIRFITRKTGKRITLPLHSVLLDHIGTLDAPDGRPEESPVHPKANSSTGSNTLSNQFAAILASAGLREKKKHRATHGKGRAAARTSNSLSFHSLRATATTLLHDAGVASATAQEIIGHDSEDIHRHYVKVDLPMLAKGINKLPDITK